MCEEECELVVAGGNLDDNQPLGDPRVIDCMTLRWVRGMNSYN